MIDKFNLDQFSFLENLKVTKYQSPFIDFHYQLTFLRVYHFKKVINYNFIN